MNKEKIEKIAREFLIEIGENPDRVGLQETPKRIANMCEEIFRGYDISKMPKITTFENGTDGIVYNEMVVDKGDFYSLCEHHARTFFGTYYFAYIPNPKGKIIGLSKIGRIVDYCGAKLQIQERLVRDIVTIIQNVLGKDYPPLGIALVLKGRHMCKESRGARKKGEMISSYMTGVFETNLQTRNEFLKLIE